MERREHLFKVPRIGNTDLVERESCLRGDGADVADHARGQIPLRRKVDQFEPIDDENLVLAQADRRPPPRPAVFCLPGVEPAAEDAENDGGAARVHRCKDKRRFLKIESSGNGPWAEVRRVCRKVYDINDLWLFLKNRPSEARHVL